MITTQTEKDTAVEQAKAQYEGILEEVEQMREASEKEDHDREEEIKESIQLSVLSVETRSGWRSPGTEEKDSEYRILLAWGGPACRITGDLDQYGQPETARIEGQDWGTPWLEYYEADEAVLLDYVNCFYFGG